MKKIFLLLVLVFLTGCGKQGVFVPQPAEEQKVVENPSYNVIAETSDIEMMFGFPKDYNGGTLEALVGVGNTTEYQAWADVSNIKVYYGDEEPAENPIRVLGYEDLQTGTKIKNFLDKFTIGTLAVANALAAQQSGHHYETSTFSGVYSGPYYGQGGTFIGSVTTHYFDPEENRRNVENAEALGKNLIENSMLRCERRYAALAAEYFGSESIPAGFSVIKKVVVKGIKVEDEPKVVTAEMYVQGITKKFKFLLSKVDEQGKDIIITKETSSAAESVKRTDENSVEQLQMLQAHENQSSYDIAWRDKEKRTN